MAYKRRGAAAAGLSLAMAGMVAVPNASAVSGVILNVDNMTGTRSDADPGTQAGRTAWPYCTIQAAAAAASPGDTVLIAGSDLTGYGTNVTICSSATATEPITTSC